MSFRSRSLRGKEIREPRLLRIVAGLICVLTIGAACGRVGDSNEPASSARTASPTPSPQVDVSTWKGYTSAKWRYSLRYPANWLNLGTLGAPDTEEYLSNENVGSPISLSPSGIFVAISIHNATNAADCALHGVPTSTGINRTESVTVNGIDSTLYAIGGDEPYFELNVMKDNYCYMLSFVFRTGQARDSTEPVVQALIGTFRFGSPPTP